MFVVPRAIRAGLWLLVLGLVAAGCAHSPDHSGQGLAAAGDVLGLEKNLAALSYTVRRDEARLVATNAYEQARQLAGDYRVVRPAILHNCLVNSGLKIRGLCYHWAEDLLAQLESFRLSTLEVRWGIARAGTVREHNALVVTARGQAFEDGIVLDGWRRSGRLVWLSVKADHYPWLEGALSTNHAPVTSPHTYSAKP